MSELTITVLYSCTPCGTLDRPLKVPARESPTVPILDWMNRVAERVSADHSLSNPSCPARKMRDLKIPMTGAAWVGGPAIE